MICSWKDGLKPSAFRKRDRLIRLHLLTHSTPA